MRKNEQSIIQINNTKDVMCMARAVVVANCGLGLWAQKIIMYAQDRENVGIVKKLLDPIINAIFKVMNVNLR